MIRNDQVSVQVGDLQSYLITLSFEALVGKCVSVGMMNTFLLWLYLDSPAPPPILIRTVGCKHILGLQCILAIRAPPFLPVNQSVNQP